MIKSLDVKNFTVYSDAQFKFGKHLNVIVGTNGTGKTHLLKLVYAMLATSWEEGHNSTTSPPSKVLLQPRLARKVASVFRPDSLGRLVRRGPGVRIGRANGRCEVSLKCSDPRQSLAFSFAMQSKSEVALDKVPEDWLNVAPCYFPTKELLTIYPGFVSLYETYHLEFEETWRDLCLLLGAPLKRGVKEKAIAGMLRPLEEAMGGIIRLSDNGRFYLKTSNQVEMEVHLVAEGLRKLGMLARLIATGTLSEKGYFFWDEPEANLNPLLVKTVVRSALSLCQAGVQVFLATHSLMVMREFDILLRTGEFPALDARWFGLHAAPDGVVIEQGTSVNDIGHVAALDEDVAQSDRFIDLETGAYFGSASVRDGGSA